jgi:hypothetical protein
MSRVAPAAAGVRSFLAVPVRRQTYLNLLYLCLSFPLGLAYFAFVALGLSLGVALAVTVVGLPLLAVVVAGALGLAGVERRLTALLLGVEMGPGARLSGASTRERLLSLATNHGTWTALVYLPTKLVFGVAAFVLVTTGLVTGTSLLFVPFYYDQPGVYVGVVTDGPTTFAPALTLGWNRLLVRVETAFSVGSWQVETLGQALAVAGVGALVVLVSLHLLNALARLSGWYARLMLGDSYDVVGGVRRTLD